eukprot:symbB.v1.2.008043.t1/scaffold501.1/size195062/4
MGAHCVKVGNDPEPMEYFKSPPAMLPAQHLFDDHVQGPVSTGASRSSIPEDSEGSSVTPTTTMTLPLCHQPQYFTENDDETPVAIPGLIDSSLAGLVSWQHPGFGAGNPILRHVQFIFQRFPIDGGRVPCGTVVRFFGNSAETD